jgi:hypothetical protein
MHDPRHASNPIMIANIFLSIVFSWAFQAKEVYLEKANSAQR